MRGVKEKGEVKPEVVTGITVAKVDMLVTITMVAMADMLVTRTTEANAHVFP